MLELKLKDGRTLNVEPGTLARDLIEQAASQKDRKSIIAARLNGKVIDLAGAINEGGEFEPVSMDSPEGLELLRHSTSHVMADAVQRLFPGVKVTIGPSIENGFYYDFDYPTGFSEDDLPKIEAKMKELIAANYPFERQELSREDALKLFNQKGEKFKVELINDLPPDAVISIYKHGDFIDLCRGPHIPSTGFIKAYKLTSTAGAYWRGDERNPMLQRIYGTAFQSPKALDDYLKRLEEARKRDHRKLARELDLFSVHEEIGPGFVVYHPNLGLVRAILEEFLKKEHIKRGYSIVYGPTLLKTALWERSGHYDHYRQNMYFTKIDEEDYGIKPMNCLSHMLIYGNSLRSYRELPLRYFEMGTVHRHEKSGVLAGLFRVRAFTQDDAHIVCMPEQLEAEILGVMNFVLDVMELFGFPVEMELSTRPKDSIGTDSDWERATNALEKALKASGFQYDVNAGEGAFYGPKIDIKLKDALDRKWQCATIQCDFTLPERFDLSYVGPDGERKRPVMIHRVVFGSMERFLGVLIEHFGGAFPVWLAPVQVRAIPIADRHHPYAEGVADKLLEKSVRVVLDKRNEKLNYKIRQAEMEKIPYMLIIGDQEEKDGTVSVRTRGREDLGKMKIEEFMARIENESRIPGTKSRPTRREVP
jgi:threonyl-tRNA synthetase